MSARRSLTTGELVAVLAPVGRPVAARPMSGGLFASVQAVELADGRTVVVKTGRRDGDAGLLTHEKDLLRAESLLLRLAEPVDGVPTPRVLHVDESRALVDVDVLVAELVPGTPWTEAELPPDAELAAAHQIGAILARLHTVTGDRFGYPEAASGVGGGTWPEAFGAMIDALLADAARWEVAVDTPRVLAAVEASTDQLAEVTTPRLVHMDPWRGNILLDPATGRIGGLIDFERGLFGDPLMDLVGHEPLRTGTLPAALVAGYVAAGGTLPVAPDAGTTAGLTPDAERRLALYRLYLTLVMTIEVVPRAYDWPDLDGYVGRLVADRATLLAQLEA